MSTKPIPVAPYYCKGCGGQSYAAVVGPSEYRLRVHHQIDCKLLAQYMAQYPSLYVNRKPEVAYR